MRSIGVSTNTEATRGSRGCGTPSGAGRWLCAGALALLLAGCAGVPGPTTEVRPEPPAVTDEDPASATRPRQVSASPATDSLGAATETPAPAPETTALSEPEQPSEPPLIWDRLRAGFALGIPDDPRIERERLWYASHPDFLERVQERARPYLRFILDEVDSRDLPHELVLLPVVESAYQPFAYSPGKAAGIWQFIPSTGRHYGLKQTWWYDGRRDIAAATDAALDYLTRLNGQFDGDWALALAAYNAGGGTVRAAIERNRRRGLPTDFWSLDLPRETEAYVPRLLAVARLFADPSSAGVELAAIPDTPYLAEVDAGGQLDLALAAEMAQLDMEALYRLNPGYNRWATDPDGPHRLLVPVESAEAIKSRLAALRPEDRLKWERYRIRRGDSLGVIAQRHRTSVSVLREVNKLKTDRIRAGAHLLIPVAAKSLQHYALSQDQRHGGGQGRARGERKISYVVQPGDTLWDIAKANRVNYRALARWNAMAPSDMLHPGQELAIWTDASGQPARGAERYVVRKGDSLYEIALRFGVSVDQLRQWNAPLGKYLQPDQVLAVSTAAAASTTQGTRSSLRYSVRKGDSLYTISRRFNVSITDLHRWNQKQLSGKYIQPGQKLKLYVDAAEQTTL
jgi:membrane-bound lytic murein transglycosylase D